MASTAMQATIKKSLVVLWLTGVALIWIDVSARDSGYFLDPKIQAKIAMVILLTLNGFLPHAAVMPAIKKAGSLLSVVVLCGDAWRWASAGMEVLAGGIAGGVSFPRPRRLCLDDRANGLGEISG
jgi:hypothetical protein